MTPYAKNRRKHYFIDKKVQTQFITKFALVVVGISVLSITLLYLSNLNTTTVAFENLRVVVKSTADFMLPAAILVFCIVAILAGVVTVAIAIFATHKIVGPLYRIRKEAEKMKDGDFTSVIHVRSDDHLKDVAAEFDALRRSVASSLSIIKVNWEPLETEFKKLQEKIKNEDERKRFEHAVLKIHAELQKFKTE